MNRVDLLNKLLAERLHKRYLEIGCAADRTFNAIQADVKVGVDPVRGGTVRATSDEFFATCHDEFDVVFIDGLHLAEQVLRDVHHSLQHLSANGVIVLHDCLPRQEVHQLRQRQTTTWNGDVWKAVVALRQQPDCDTAVVEADWGLGIVLPRPNSAPIRVDGELSWRRYQKQREVLLRVIRPQELDRFLSGEGLPSTPPEPIAIPNLPLPDDATQSARTNREPLHFVLTRFNVGNCDTEWLEHRMQLFERFTLPSLRSQTNQNFIWLLFG